MSGYNPYYVEDHNPSSNPYGAVHNPYADEVPEESEQSEESEEEKPSRRRKAKSVGPNKRRPLKAKSEAGSVSNQVKKSTSLKRMTKPSASSGSLRSLRKGRSKRSSPEGSVRSVATVDAKMREPVITKTLRRPLPGIGDVLNYNGVSAVYAGRHQVCKAVSDNELRTCELLVKRLTDTRTEWTGLLQVHQIDRRKKEVYLEHTGWTLQEIIDTVRFPLSRIDEFLKPLLLHLCHAFITLEQHRFAHSGITAASIYVDAEPLVVKLGDYQFAYDVTWSGSKFSGKSKPAEPQVFDVAAALFSVGVIVKRLLVVNCDPTKPIKEEMKKSKYYHLLENMTIDDPLYRPTPRQIIHSLEAKKSSTAKKRSPLKLK